MTALGRALRAARWALLLAVCLPAPLHARSRAVWETTAVVTHFDEGGLTYYGYPTVQGETVACSWDLPALALVTLPDGTTYRCEDRGGGLDAEAARWQVPSAIDVYCPGCWWVDAVDGPVATVTVEAE